MSFMKIAIMAVLSVLLCSDTNAQGGYSNSPIAPAAPSFNMSSVPGINYPTTLPFVNCTRVWTPNYPNVNPGAFVNADMDPNEADVMAQYYDGLGRIIQKVEDRSALGAPVRDWVTMYGYNDQGRLVTNPIPFRWTSYSGKFKTDGETALLTEANAAYPGLEPYQILGYDGLNRVIMQKEPGLYNTVPISHYKKYFYGTNTANEVFSITIEDQSNSVPVLDFYPANTLEKNTFVDEDDKVTINYKDKSGKLIATESVLDANNTNPHGGKACTYYVYDDLGRLRMVLPPVVIEQLLTQQTYPFALNSNLIANYCYKYFYDNKGRLIEKKLPEKEVEYYVYDKKDRLVFKQDGNLRANNQWEFTLYDAIDRPFNTGIYKPATSTDPSILNDRITNPSYTPPANSVFSYIRDYNTFNAANPFVSDGDPMKMTYYDHYDYFPFLQQSQVYFDAGYNNLLTGGAPQASLPVMSDNTRGLVTGSFANVVGGSPNQNLLKSDFIYDEYGRMIQQKSDNLHQGIDITTNQYDFSNAIVSTVFRQQNPAATTPAGFANPNLYKNTTVTTSYSKLNTINKLGKITQTINGKTMDIARYYYDNFNRIKSKTMPATYEEYKYTIKNELASINEDHVLNGQIPSGLPRFGEILSFSDGFSKKLYNGNISGIQWRNPGGGANKRFYGFQYDNLNRLTKAEFGEYSKYVVPPSPTLYTGWNKNTIDYSMPQASYDINGNMLNMVQYGTYASTSPAAIDDIQYHYKSYSNQLDWVADNANNNTPLPDFKESSSSNNQAGEYTYDGNGNLKTDKNKGVLSPIQYTFFNKPQLIDMNGKGTVKYVYDGDGNRLQKIVTDNLSNTTTTYDYIGPFLYKNNELQYISHKEGRCRPLPDPQQQEALFKYDYFTKDHLGNVRAVIAAEYTEGETITEWVYRATHEVAVFNSENLVWDNIAAVVAPKPASTTPGDVMAAELDGNDPNKIIGTALLLKVMPGDKLKVATDAYHNCEEASTTTALPANTVVDALLTALTGGQTFEGINVSEIPENTQIIQSCLADPALAEQYNNLLQASTDPSKPLGYLNYLVFDDNFHLVQNNSGVIQATTGAAGTWTTAGSADYIEIGQPGYFLTFISTQQTSCALYMDKVAVMFWKGNVLEEDHYYPFGLTLTSNTINIAEKNNTKYNSKELQRDEFTDPNTNLSTGLELYDYGARMYDPQLGRWNGVDASSESYYPYSPYAYVGNNPVRRADMDGKDWLDKVAGAVYAIVDNATNGIVNGRGTWHPTDAHDYNVGQNAGDVASLVMGAIETGQGATTATAGVAITVGSGGAAAVAGGAAVVVGSLQAAHGEMTASNGAYNLAVQKGRVNEGKYSNVPDPRNAGEGRKFTQSQKQKIIEENKRRNGGVIKSDKSGQVLDKAQRVEKGQRANMNQAEVDHIIPKSKGGTNESSNAQILSKEENLNKSNKE